MTTLAELIQQGFRSVAIDVTGVVIDANSKFAQKSELTGVVDRVTALEESGGSDAKLDKTEAAETYLTKKDMIDVCNEVIAEG